MSLLLLVLTGNRLQLEPLAPGLWFESRLATIFLAIRPFCDSLCVWPSLAPVCLFFSCLRWPSLAPVWTPYGLFFLAFLSGGLLWCHKEALWPPFSAFLLGGILWCQFLYKSLLDSQSKWHLHSPSISNNQGWAWISRGDPPLKTTSYKNNSAMTYYSGIKVLSLGKVQYLDPWFIIRKITPIDIKEI